MNHGQITYFCVCFICESETICAHRETDLVMWWLLQLRNRGLLNAAAPLTLAPKPAERESRPALTEVTRFSRGGGRW